MHGQKPCVCVWFSFCVWNCDQASPRSPTAHPVCRVTTVPAHRASLHPCPAWPHAGRPDHPGPSPPWSPCVNPALPRPIHPSHHVPAPSRCFLLPACLCPLWSCPVLLPACLPSCLHPHPTGPICEQSRNGGWGASPTLALGTHLGPKVLPGQDLQAGHGPCPTVAHGVASAGSSPQGSASGSSALDSSFS